LYIFESLFLARFAECFRSAEIRHSLIVSRLSNSYSILFLSLTFIPPWSYEADAIYPAATTDDWHWCTATNW